MRITGGGLRLAASDVANFLACQHLTRLDLLRARGELAPPYESDLGFRELVERGMAHEWAVLDRFRADGCRVAVIAEGTEAEAARATRQAIGGGADVIYQGVLLRDQAPALLGRPDFLVRAGLLDVPDGEPRPEQMHYEVVDAKLARSAKGRAIAQTAFYSQLLADAQGIRPRWMHLALGTGEFVPFKVDDYAAYERQTRQLLGEFISMATSSAGEAPRGLEFLFDPHRLNVATSRARAMSIIVASPDLVRVSCRTPRQMLLVNALCRAWESGAGGDGIPS